MQDFLTEIFFKILKQSFGWLLCVLNFHCWSKISDTLKLKEEQSIVAQFVGDLVHCHLAPKQCCMTEGCGRGETNSSVHGRAGSKAALTLAFLSPFIFHPGCRPTRLYLPYQDAAPPSVNLINHIQKLCQSNQ